MTTYVADMIYVAKCPSCNSSRVWKAEENQSFSNNAKNVGAEVSHLTTLVSRLLRSIENVKSWNQLDDLKGETELRHHVSNIIEYTFFLHSQVNALEVEKK